MSVNVNNINLVYYRLLKFAAPGEFYIAEALCRPKKDGESTLGGSSNNHTRMVKMWTIYSIEDWDRLEGEMVRVCDANNARLYFLPQPRTVYSALKSLISNSLDKLECDKINFQKLLSSSLCGLHDSPCKRWVLDIDHDDKVLLGYIRAKRVGTEAEHYNIVGKDIMDAENEVFANVRQRVEKCGTGTVEDVVFLPTANGVHIVTPPFSPAPSPKINLPPMPQPWNPEWLKKDAMTLVYTPNHSEAEGNS